jgi:hypothetical protein
MTPFHLPLPLRIDVPRHLEGKREAKAIVQAEVSKGPAPQYSGDEWQSHVFDLLIYIHGFTEFARVPDEHLGDYGIEAFSFAGDAYQCFADQGSNSKVDRYVKQRDKLTADIGTFCAKSAEILKLTHGNKIRRYIFVVPLNDHKDLIKHAATKTAEVRLKNLPHVTDDFEIVVKDQRGLDVYERMLKKSGGAKLKLSDESLDDFDIKDVKAAVDSGELQTLLGKLSRAYPALDKPSLEERVNRLLKINALGQNRLREISEGSQQTYQNMLAEITARERRLTTVGPLARPTPVQVLQDEISELTNNLKTQAEDIDSATIESISLSAVTTWMLRCPLDF